MSLALIAGTVLLVYPSASDYWNSFHQSQSIMGYAEQVAQMSAADHAKFISEAAEYNAMLAKNGNEWKMNEAQKKEYESKLTFSSTGVMGYIDVPKINVKLPIYHGTSDAVLQTSIGHLPETSLPVGGSGSHCVLSGHRGLPSARLFSDLDKMSYGDTFTLSVLNETYTYQVDQIRVVEPTDIRELKIQPDMDLCTLVTCTPYGINSHRLLVRGHRIQNANGDAQVVADALQINPAHVAPFFMIIIISGLLVVFFTKTGKRNL
ncbi:MAG: class C sortase [Stomatobaculum sp.]|nr:class C sortase [Stomatobaculum sp.]